MLFFVRLIFHVLSCIDAGEKKRYFGKIYTGLKLILQPQVILCLN